MVIVSNIYEVAFRSYMQFLFYRNVKKLYLPGSTDTKTCVYTHLEKHILRMTRDSYGFLTMLKLFTLLYLIRLYTLQMHELCCLNCIEPFHQYACY